MNKQKVNYVVDFLALVSFIITALSGLAIKFFMPSGVRQGRFQEFLGIQKGTWSGAHDFFGILMIVLVAIHFILHWDWIVSMTKNMLKTNNSEIKK